MELLFPYTIHVTDTKQPHSPDPGQALRSRPLSGRSRSAVPLYDTSQLVALILDPPGSGAVHPGECVCRCSTAEPSVSTGLPEMDGESGGAAPDSLLEIGVARWPVVTPDGTELGQE